VWEEEEVHTVVYTEYFGASQAELVLIPHYRHYYGWTDDDIYFLWFCSRRANVSFEICCNNYYRNCGGDYNRLIVSYNIPRASFFVSINAGGSYPPVYARTYACYHSNTYDVNFSHEEYHALVSMKVGVEYQGHTPTTFMAKVQSGTPPNRIVVQSKESCGKGGVTVTGAAVVHTAPHPWTLPPAQHQQWQKDHQNQVAKSEVGFKEQHKEQVQKVQLKEKEQARDKAKDPKTTAQPPPGKDKDKERDKDDKAHLGGTPPKDKDKDKDDKARGQPGEKPPPKAGDKPPPPKPGEKPPPKPEEKKEEKKEK